MSVKKVLLLVGGESRLHAAGAVLEAEMNLDAVVTPRSARVSPEAGALREIPCEFLCASRDEILPLVRRHAPDVILSVGWPHLFGPEMLEGSWLLLNSHPTLLPKFRGPNPWYYVLAAGERESGVTVHKIDEGMDTGPILHQRAFPLTPFDTYRSLRSKTLALEPVVIREALALLRSGKGDYRPQPREGASSFPGLRRSEDSRIDPSLSLTELVDSIRGCDPEHFPAFFDHHGQRVYVRLARASRPKDDHPESL